MNHDKKTDCPATTQNSPKEASTSLSVSISQKTAEVNSNSLRALRLEKNIPPKEIVEVVREMFPKYDKMLQSKCEHSDTYGIELRKEAMDAILAKYNPEQLEAIKRKRRGGHKLTKRISCRLADDEYDKLIKYTHEDGFDEMQAWLTFIVRKYLKSKAGKEKQNGIQHEKGD